MRKKLLGIVLAGALSASIIAGSAISAGAVRNSDGTYTPSADVVEEGVYNYMFAMPSAWLNVETAKTGDSAGIYWWGGSDTPDSLPELSGHGWPGYKAEKVTDEEGVDNLFSIQVPKDAPMIVWNNYLDGGTDKTLPIYLLATQAKDFACEFYAEGEGNYPASFWEVVMDCADNDMDFSIFGDYADNFFDDEEYGSGIVFNFNNMVYVVDLDNMDVNYEGKPTYTGNVYFYYGNGEYGNWPTKELAEEHKDDEGTVTGNFTTYPYVGGEAPVVTLPAETIPAANNQNATSATKAAATGDSANTTNNSANGSVATGEFSMFAIAFVVVAGALGTFYFVRKRYNK